MLQPLQAEVGRVFADWKAVARRWPVPHSRRPAVGATTQDVAMPGKTSVSVVLVRQAGCATATATTRRCAWPPPSWVAAFTGRLMANVRDKEGLTYGVGAGLGNDMFNDGDWHYGHFRAALLDKGIASTQRQLTLWYDAGVTPG